MEGLAEAAIQLAGLLGAGGLGAALLSYHRNRRKDSMDSYSDLVGKLEARCEQQDKRIDALEADLRRERAECDEKLAAAAARIDGLERQLAQVGISGAYLIDKINDK